MQRGQAFVLRGFLFAALSCSALSNVTSALGATAFVGSSDKFADFGAIHYVAEPGETNHVTVNFDDGAFSFLIRDTGATITPGAGCTSISPDTVQCNETSEVLEATLADGDDFISVNVEDRTVLRGGDGDDRLDGSSNPGGRKEFLFGGAGDDVLRGRGGTDFLNGGAGADLMSGGTSCDFETAGQCFINFDTVTYAGRSHRVRADADIAAADDGEWGEGDTILADIERIVGGAGNDVLGGITTNFFTFDSSKVLVGMSLEGRGGNDVLGGTRGRDSIFGGLGDDVFRGGKRADTLAGQQGADRITGGPGRDRLRGGSGRDRLFARDLQRDRVNGGRGTDSARIDKGLDVVLSIATFF
jgi:Ca2+-binding RTX toxin-like protein